MINLAKQNILLRFVESLLGFEESLLGFEESKQTDLKTYGPAKCIREPRRSLCPDMNDFTRQSCRPL